jgi:hypothetical protein
MRAHKLFLLGVLLLAMGLYGCGETNNASGGSGTGGSGTGGSGSSGGPVGSSSSGSGAGNGPADPDPSGFPSVGVPDQNSLSVSVSNYNPRARNVDGTQVSVTARLADQLNNNTTIPDGTPVYFATEGGSIEPVCTTTGGVCAVTWTSQNPRPDPGPVISDPLGSTDQVFSYSSGRATVLAWALGTESFIDNNSNGLFDSGDVQVVDNPEAFLDKNENGLREVNEEFVNYPLPQIGFFGTYDGADGLYSGANCSHPSLCDVDETVFIFDNFELVMASDSVCTVHVDPLVDPGGGQPPYYPSTVHGLTTLTTGNSFTFGFLIHDCFGNSPMAGTSISFSAEVGIIRGPSAFTIPNTSVDMGTTDTGDTRQRYPVGSLVYTVTIEGSLDNQEEGVGRLEVNVTTPGGLPGYTFVPLLDPADP